MPLAPNPPNTPAPAPTFPKNIAPKIAAPEFRTSVTDSRYEPISALITHIEGSSWRVEYFSQAIGHDEELSPYQPGQLPVYQSYMHIKDFELKVSSPLAGSQNTETNSFEISGTALVYPFFIPNTGDQFIGDVGDGRQGRFTVNQVERKTILRQTCYEINYTLNEYVNESIYNDLLTKVVKTVYFQKDFTVYGQNPLITETELYDKNKIVKLRATLLDRYFQWFYSAEFRTFLVPGQGPATYDPFVTKTMLGIYPANAHPLIRKTRELNIDRNTFISTMNLWNVLLKLNGDLMNVISQQMGVVLSSSFGTWPIHESVYFSGIPQIVYPYPSGRGIDNEYTDDCTCCETGGTLNPLDDISIEVGDLFPYIYASGLNSDPDNILVKGANPDLTVPPLIHPVTIDDYYVLSRRFYEEWPIGQSQLELLTRSMLNGEVIDRVKLFAVIDSQSSWGRIEKFYYTPLVVILLNAALRTLS